MSSSPLTVKLPSQTSPSYNQTVLGKKSPVSEKIEEFRGIPFGIIPGRWKHSHVRKSLPTDATDVFHAGANGPKCPQIWGPNSSEGGFGPHIDFPSDVTESEFDCLNLFIIRPSNEALNLQGFDYSKEPLPVLVWIHGGGYGFGASTDPMWDPTNLVLESLRLGKPFIAVSVNYRLNLFGFGASSEMLQEQSFEELRGVNFGLRDQKVALQWVSNNISAFGGDPSKVTIGGQSAGASSIHVLALEAKLNQRPPLFHRAIIQSGAIGCLGPISVERADADQNALLRHLEIAKEDGASKLAALRDVSAEKLVQASHELRWAVFPLVNDNLTLNVTDKLAPILADLGDTGTGKADLQNLESIAILLGEVDQEGTINTQQVSSITGYEEVQKHFNSAFTNPSNGEKALGLWGLSADVSVDTLRDRLIRFLTEIQFGYPLSAAYKFLAKEQSTKEESVGTPQVFHNSTTERYKINFGNPFPVPIRGLAHHCVDLIYIFNAFHDHLLKADENSKASPGSEYSSEEGLIPRSKEPSSIYPDNVSRSNDDLRKEVQAKWINFIVEGHSRRSDIDDTSVLLFGRDRKSKIVSVNEESSYQDQAKRFQFVDEHLLELQAVVTSITDTTAYGRAD